MEIRSEILGPHSLQVADIYEQLGKIYVEQSQFQKAYTSLQDCYAIRKRILSKPNAPEQPEITRISVLLLYLYQRVDSELALNEGPNGQQALKLAEISFDIKSVIEDEVKNLKQPKKQASVVPDLHGEALLI